MSLNHSSIESGVSKRAPFAPRSFLGQSPYDIPKVVNGKAYSMMEYNPLEDPHLSDYYARKLGMLPGLSDSAKKVRKIMKIQYFKNHIFMKRLIIINI